MNAKKALLVLAVVFLGFWMFRDPSGLAASSSQAGGAVWDGATQLFEATIRFINELV
jgi:hypothetical protein